MCFSVKPIVLFSHQIKNRQHMPHSRAKQKLDGFKTPLNVRPFFSLSSCFQHFVRSDPSVGAHVRRVMGSQLFAAFTVSSARCLWKLLDVSTNPNPPSFSTAKQTLYTWKWIKDKQKFCYQTISTLIQVLFCVLCFNFYLWPYLIIKPLFFTVLDGVVWLLTGGAFHFSLTS